MGEIADDMIEGRSCSCCGIYFKGEHGFPVLCNDCWKGWTPKERKQAGVQKATLPEVGDEDREDCR